MRIPDPRTVSVTPEKNAIIFAVSQRQGRRPRQEDCFAHFGEECFVLADGVGGLPHGDVAARLAADTAVWAYRHVRQRRFYWQDKKLLLVRVFRTANISLWQKRRETGFDRGLASTLVACIVGPRNFWVGSIGDSGAFLLREGVFARLTEEDLDQYGYLTKALGVARYGLVPQWYGERFVANDIILLASDGVTGYVAEAKLKEILETPGSTQAEITALADKFLDVAEAMGSTDNMTACVIKRVSVAVAKIAS